MQLRTDTELLNNAVCWNNSVAWLSAALFSSASGIGALEVIYTLLNSQCALIDCAGFLCTHCAIDLGVCCLKIVTVFCAVIECQKG